MARPPPPTPPHFIIRPPRASPASFCFRRQGCHPSKRSNGDSQLSKCILQHQQSHEFSKLYCTIVTVLLLMFPTALILHLGMPGAKPRYYPCSYTFLLIHLCRNVTVHFCLCFTRQLRWFCKKKFTKKIIF
jgi:hypothetical protein